MKFNLQLLKQEAPRHFIEKITSIRTLDINNGNKKLITVGIHSLRSLERQAVTFPR